MFSDYVLHLHCWCTVGAQYFHERFLFCSVLFVFPGNNSGMAKGNKNILKTHTHAHLQLDKCWLVVMWSVAMEGMLSARVCGHYEWTRFTVGKIPYSG